MLLMLQAPRMEACKHGSRDTEIEGHTPQVASNSDEPPLLHKHLCPSTLGVQAWGLSRYSQVSSFHAGKEGLGVRI